MQYKWFSEYWPTISKSTKRKTISLLKQNGIVNDKQGNLKLNGISTNLESNKQKGKENKE